MPESPAQLRKICPQIPRYTGTVKLSAGFLSFKDQDLKKAWLGVAWPMQAAKAIPQVGATADEAQRTSHTKLARMMGVERETFCRRLLLFSEPAVEWSDEHKERNAKHLLAMNAKRKSERQVTSPAVPQGDGAADCVPSDTDPGTSDHPITRSPDHPIQAKPIFFHKSSSGVGVPLFYTEAMDPELAAKGHRNPLKKADKHQDAANLATAFGEQWFDKESTWRGYFEVETYIFSEYLIDTKRCICRKGQMKFNFQSDCGICGGKGFLDLGKPLGTNPRTFMIVLKGLGLERNGSVTKTQEELAKLCGMSVGTISRCQDKWEHLGLIESIPGEVIYETNLEGQPVLNEKGEKIIKTRAPQKIIWLPGRVLDDEIAERERMRLNNILIVQGERLKLLPAYEQNKRIKDLQAIRALHSDLLREWRGTQRRVEAVWKEMRFRMQRQNLNMDLYKALFPFYRE